MTQQDVIDFLSNPQSHGLSKADMARLDTHISTLVLAGDKAYKIKRAIKLSFLDFSTLERRKYYCDQEFTINKTFTPSLYLGVQAIYQDHAGQFNLNGDGQIVEWMVVMHRFDQQDIFAERARHNQLCQDDLDPLIFDLVQFHQKALPSDRFGGLQGQINTLNGDKAAFQACPSGIFAPEMLESLFEKRHAKLTEIAELLEQRRENKMVRPCHGDLHLGNITLFQRRAILFDAIEFDPAMSTIDIVYDLSFLIMDLMAFGYDGLANFVLNRYLGKTGDIESLACLPSFLSSRASIRAHVRAQMSQHQQNSQARDTLIESARNYLDLANRVLSPIQPKLICIAGFSGSGKSSLAAAIAPSIGSSPGAYIARSDVIRKRLLGVDAYEKLPESAYQAGPTKKTFARLYEELSIALKAGHSVIADAIFARPEQREKLSTLAQNHGVPFYGFWLDVAPEVMAQRITSRHNSASDATVAVLEAQRTYELGDISWPRLENNGDIELPLTQIYKHLTSTR